MQYLSLKKYHETVVILLKKKNYESQNKQLIQGFRRIIEKYFINNNFGNIAKVILCH